MSAQRRQDDPSDAAGRIDLERLRSILPAVIDSLNDAVLVVDGAQRVVAANRRYTETFARGASPLLRAVCTTIAGFPDSEGHSDTPCPTCTVLNRRLPEKRLRVLRDSAGTRRLWEGTYSPVFDGDGSVTHVVEVWRDVSERSRLESQLSHSERLASLGILAAGVAHEVNNPLASVLAGVEALRRRLVRSGVGVSPDVETLLDVLERETNRVRTISDKLMLLAQPYSEAPVWVDLNRAVEDTATLLRYQMEKQRIELNLELDPELGAIHARESGVRGVCMNLMMNAVQAMPEGGLLTVRTRPGRTGVLLEILDTGPGIPPEHLDRIWDPFFTTKPTGKGTGLGLSIAQRVVTRHGGTIHAENRPGSGARFLVELPERSPGGGDD